MLIYAIAWVKNAFHSQSQQYLFKFYFLKKKLFYLKALLSYGQSHSCHPKNSHESDTKIISTHIISAKIMWKDTTI